MKKNIQSERIWAVERYFDGMKPSQICKVLNRTKSWLFKWISRYDCNSQSWNSDKLKKPLTSPSKISFQIEETVKLVRLHLYNQGLFCGAQAILWELKDMNIIPIPSIRTINRILSRNDLTNRRTGRYIPKGKKYPALIAKKSNDVHQTDIVGPIYLKGPIRFYNLNVVDIYTGRCATEPMNNCSSQAILDAFWAIWWRLGIPENIQVDNELTFFGSNRYPRGMGVLIRLCLNNNIIPWFIPQREPWRNGVVERFNEHYRQKFIDIVPISGESELKEESLNFEKKHNMYYRYSKLNGKTLLEVLSESKNKLKFPQNKMSPKHPLDKPVKGRYNIVRFIRSDLRLNIFSEKFIMPSDYMYEYVVATIYVKEQKLKIFHDKIQVEEFDYKLR
jgi:transposase InsO family protein